MTAPLHEQECFACWLRAIGADTKLVQSILTNAFLIGAATGIGTAAAQLGANLRDAQLNLVHVRLTSEALDDIESMVRADMAAPASPDVARAMAHDHGGAA